MFGSSWLTVPNVADAGFEIGTLKFARFATLNSWAMNSKS